MIDKRMDLVTAVDGESVTKPMIGGKGYGPRQRKLDEEVGLTKEAKDIKKRLKVGKARPEELEAAVLAQIAEERLGK